ncbi:hypothetical protein [Paraburkholderia bannensis]|uniref:hypothetical protein n=1 Tax=Paraburkholderia bannensis TaxID=765414 RepID=UPI0038B7E0F3
MKSKRGMITHVMAPNVVMLTTAQMSMSMTIRTIMAATDMHAATATAMIPHTTIRTITHTPTTMPTITAAMITMTTPATQAHPAATAWRRRLRAAVRRHLRPQARSARATASRTWTARPKNG